MAGLARTFNSIGVWKSFGRYSVLKTLFLGDGEKMNQAQLSKVLGVTSPNISYLVDSLEVEGLVERRPGEVDRRSTDVALTAAGRELCEKLVPAVSSPAVLAGFRPKRKSSLMPSWSASGSAQPPAVEASASSAKRPLWWEKEIVVVSYAVKWKSEQGRRQGEGQRRLARRAGLCPG
jgi:DNA-binding MarR family transcriptional regulator